MSAWRRVAIEKIPRYRKLIEHSESIGMLWIDLRLRFVDAHSEPVDEELIGQIYDYASWCIASRDPDTFTTGALYFYEHLPTEPKVREQVARWLTAEEFSRMTEIFRYHLSDKEHKEFVRQFYEQKEMFRHAAKKGRGARRIEPLLPG